MTGPSNPAGEHAGTDPSALIRHTVDTLNSDALDELYDEIDRLRAKVAEFDHIINWHTTCASCARILDSAYQETMRAEKAGQQRDQLTATLREVIDLFTPAATLRDTGAVIAYTATEDVIDPARMRRWRTVLDEPKERP